MTVHSVSSQILRVDCVVLSVAGPDLESDQTRYYRAVIHDLNLSMERDAEDYPNSSCMDEEVESDSTNQEVEESSVDFDLRAEKLLRLSNSIFGMPQGENW
jgi:hypothetical protein